VGKVASKLSDVATAAMGKFPNLSKIISTETSKFAERVLLRLWGESSKIRSFITSHPLTKPLLHWLGEAARDTSVSRDAWWSKAVGCVKAKGGRQLNSVDFTGQCVCYALTGAVGPGNFGTYVLFFGIDRQWSPLWNIYMVLDFIQMFDRSKGFAVISSASTAIGFPSIGAGATIFYGEIV
jgi:hypothetical protein